MKIRNIATVYVFNEDKILLMHRVGSRLFSGSIWVGIGGHFEPDEACAPTVCALRELREETGLLEEDISPPRLRYITTRLVGDEIRQQYIFTAMLKNKFAALTTSDEGELHWIPLTELFLRKHAFSNEHCLRHYLASGGSSNEVFAACVSENESGLYVQITALKEYSNNH